MTNLSACETYAFAVGVVGPYGYGPLSSNFKQLSTSENHRAAPKNLKVVPLNGDRTRMKVQWEHNCPISNPDYYIVSSLIFRFSANYLKIIVNFHYIYVDIKYRLSIGKSLCTFDNAILFKNAILI